jgi:hypothetical protein
MHEVEATIRRRLRESPLLCRALALLAIAHPILQLAVWLPFQWSRHDRERDVVAYFQTAMRLGHHQSLYQPLPNFGPDGHGTPYLYPPQFALLLAPLDHLSFQRFCLVWYPILILGFWGFAWALDRLASKRASAMGTLYWGLILAVTPGAYEAMSEGQIDPVVWAIFGLALVSRFRGLIFGILTHIKLFGLFPIIIAIKREPKVATTGFITVAAGFLLGVAVYGPAAMMQWIKWALPIPGQGHFDEYNLSLSFLGLRIARATGLWHYPGGPLAPLPHLYLQAALAAAVIASLWFTRRMPSPQNYIVVLLTVLIFSPTCWYTYVPLAYTLVAVSLARNGAAGGATDDTVGRGERT